jgi:hypothetical protein
LQDLYHGMNTSPPSQRPLQDLYHGMNTSPPVSYGSDLANIVLTLGLRDLVPASTEFGQISRHDNPGGDAAFHERLNQMAPAFAVANSLFEQDSRGTVRKGTVAQDQRKPCSGPAVAAAAMVSPAPRFGAPSCPDRPVRCRTIKCRRSRRRKLFRYRITHCSNHSHFIQKTWCSRGPRSNPRRKNIRVANKSVVLCG